MHGPKRNTVNIRLTESAVFLRTDDSTGRRPASRSSLLRGLLVIDLVKPTRITSIDVKLLATSSTAWPEGYGPRKSEITEKTQVFSISTALFDANNSARRHASIGPGVYLNEEVVEDLDDDRLTLPRARSRGAIQDLEPMHTRRRSRDIQRAEIDTLAEIPPYSRLPPPRSPSFSTERLPLSSHPSGHLETVDEYPTGFSYVHDAHHSVSPTPIVHSSASSMRSVYAERSSSRRFSIDEPYDTPSGRSSAHNSPLMSPTLMAGDAVPGLSESRGRRTSARFSLSSVSSALKEVVRSRSPRVVNRSKERELSADDLISRGRTRVKGSNTTPTESPVPIGLQRPLGSRERLASLLGDIWKNDSDEQWSGGEGWKEFKAGTYTYPISFTIPANAPPTLHTNYGSVSWSLRATVHRPGTFTSKLEALREVIVVSCPTEEDTEDTENIIVERHWDSQLQYLISISGRSFFIGGTMPISLSFMPLAKVKIHRISVVIEEKTEYLTHNGTVHHTDTPLRITLLSVKHDEKDGGHILPLESDDPEAFSHSPLQALLRPEDDISDIAPSLMGPGPWIFQQELQLPRSCRQLHFTNKNKLSNVLVSHTLKCILRVESSDPASINANTGKKKLFDIVVQTPIHILSCRCKPEWTSLPNYTRSFEDPTAVAHQCPCQSTLLQGFHFSHNLAGPLETTLTHESDSDASATESHPVDLNTMRSLRNIDSVMGRTNLYDRLVSGQQGVLGEAPPAYGA